MQKIAVFGGTRFFGKQVVEKLKAINEFTVDVYSRNMDADFKFDRSDPVSVENALSKGYDIIIDNICFSSFDANLVIDFFHRNINKLPELYVLTSTSFVYKGYKGQYDESIRFDRTTQKKNIEVSYEDGKRKSEYAFEKSILYQRLLVIRPPYVIGKNDHTGRLGKMLKTVQRNSSINININDSFSASYVDSDFLSDMIVFLIEKREIGVFNIANSECLSIKDIYEEIAKLLEKEIKFSLDNIGSKLLHPYSLNQNLCLSIQKIENKLSNNIPSIRTVIPKIIKELI